MTGKMRSLTLEIKEKARDLGFCEVGVARVENPGTEAARFDEWLARGYHGTMAWMALNREKRADPRAILPGAKSVIAGAMNYYADVPHVEDIDVGKISRYAWGDDYHEVVRSRLEQLLAFVKSKHPAEGKVYVDTGPVMDKVWAQKAGVGWEGKHTNVITRTHGSWVFLGEIILDIVLDYDAPATDHCGSCTLCIEACPTGAIVEPYVLDSNLCISYLTIEHRGDIPDFLGGKLGQWIYGCDVCQDVCPWNQKFARPSDEHAFLPRDGNVAPRLEDFLTMTQEKFSRTFQGSPVKRTKLAGLTRNVKAIMDEHSKSSVSDEQVG